MAPPSSVVASSYSTSSDSAFCLKLNSHQNHLVSAFQRLYNDNILTDCTISCQGGTIKVHKLVLSACSPYFTDLFTCFSNPNQYPIVILKDMSITDLEAIIEFMYKGEVTIPQSSLPSVLDSAKALMVIGLMDIKVETDSSRKNNKRKKRSHVSNNSDKSPVDEVSGSEVSENDQSENESQSKILATVDDSSRSPLPGPSTRCKLSPSAALKANLRQMRIEKIQHSTGGLSGRKMWSEEETKTLVDVWDEESAGVWGSAGKKMLSLQKISDLLQERNVDRDISQVEGKIKALKRDFKAVKTNKAIPSVQARMAPYLDKLESIFLREEL